MPMQMAPCAWSARRRQPSWAKCWWWTTRTRSLVTLRWRASLSQHDTPATLTTSRLWSSRSACAASTAAGRATGPAHARLTARRSPATSARSSGTRQGSAPHVSAPPGLPLPSSCALPASCTSNCPCLCPPRRALLQVRAGGPQVALLPAAVQGLLLGDGLRPLPEVCQRLVCLR